METVLFFKYLLVAVFAVLLISSDLSVSAKSIQKRSLGQIFRSWKYAAPRFWQPLWEPEISSNRTRADWLRCRGMDCEQWDSVKETMNEIKEIQNLITYGELSPTATSSKLVSQSKDDDSIMDGCLLMTKEQANIALANMKTAQRMIASMRDKRPKRKIEHFKNYPQAKWDRTIFYKFDGGHTDSEKEQIRGAFRHWEAQTCIRFFEVNINAPMGNLHHILVTNQPNGCYSYVGKVTLFPQPVNLADACLQSFGIAVHEIGHALGMWHEQQRPDRDQHIRVIWDNIGAYQSQFWPRYGSETHEVPYDAGSVMHYGSKAGSKNGKNTMETVNPLYQKNMGQRLGLSFYDTKIVNKAYCSNVCAIRLPKECKRGGYQDPNNCDQCRCPDGFGGTYCQEVQKSVGAQCGGKIKLESGETRSIQSPGYGQNGYNDRTECNWYFEVPEGHRVSLEFDNKFGLYCEALVTCLHWLEVRYQKDLVKPGPRFCCYQKPDPLVSEDREMLLVMRANHTTPANWINTRQGFKATVRAVSLGGANSGQTPPAVTSKPTTTTTSLPPNTKWGEWGRCQNHECKCGGWSTTRRHLMCGSRKCRGTLGRVQDKTCDRLCKPTDTYLTYIGKFLERECGLCAPGFKPDIPNKKCLPKI